MNSRWLVGAVCCGLLLYAVGAIPPFGSKSTARAGPRTNAPAASTPKASTEESYAADYAVFGAELIEFCAGDGSNRDRLDRIAQRMAEQHGRGDALRVVEHYTRIRPADRAQGLLAYAEVDGFHERAEGQNADEWHAQRPILLADIERFVARTLPLPEFTAAGNALALASEIRVDWSAAVTRRVEDSAQLESRWQRARQDAMEAIALFDRAGMETPKLRPLLQLGRLAVLQGHEGLARERFVSCLELARHCRRPEYEADALVALIHMARSAGDGPELELRLSELAPPCAPRKTRGSSHANTRCCGCTVISRSGLPSS